MEQQWIPSCLEHHHTFLSTLYIASAHYDLSQNHEVESLATAALRQDIIYVVGGNLTNPETSVADPNIMAVVQLLAGELIARNEGTLKYHEAGMEKMITYRGGLNHLGKILASMVSWISLMSAVLREEKVNPIFHDYSQTNSSKSYTLTQTVPESPLYYPHGKYMTIERSTRYNSQLRGLLDDARMMIDTFLKEVSTELLDT
jgi:hypothetical protein